MQSKENDLESKTRFLVVGASVTDLEILSNLLDGYQDIDCSPFPRVSATAGEVDALYADCATGSSATVCGVVLPLHSGQFNCKEVMGTPGIKKIVLSRTNVLASYLSAQRMKHVRRLAFVHIPKTAGMSLHSVLKNHFGVDASYRAGDVQTRSAFLEAPVDHFSNYRYVTGHLSLKEMVDKGVDAPFVSVIRNPVDRLISMLRYHNKSEHDDHKDLYFSGIDRFVEFVRKNSRIDMQCWHFGGSRSFEDAVEYIERHHVYVAPLEYYDDFLTTLSEVLGEQLENVQLNVTPKGEGLTLTDDDLQKLLPLVQNDLKLFEYIHDNYDIIKQRFMENLMRKTDEWKLEKVHFDDRAFARYREEYEACNSEILSYLNEMKQDYLLLNGSVFDVDHIDSVLTYLNILQRKGSFDNLLATVRENVVEGFLNPDDVRSYLKDSKELDWAFDCVAK